MITHVRVNIGGAPLCYRRSQGMRLDGNLRVRLPLNRYLRQAFSCTLEIEQCSSGPSG